MDINHPIFKRPCCTSGQLVEVVLFKTETTNVDFSVNVGNWAIQRMTIIGQLNQSNSCDPEIHVATCGALGFP